LQQTPDWPLPIVQGLKSAARLKEVAIPAMFAYSRMSHAAGSMLGTIVIFAMSGAPVFGD
jgi:hypothetical protein